MLIQIILLALVALIVLRLVVKYSRQEVNLWQYAGWLVFWLIVGGIVAWPQSTVWLANQVGVGRGADLVVYIGMIALFYLVFRLVLRLEKMEKNLTLLTRSEALKEHERNNQ